MFLDPITNPLTTWASRVGLPLWRPQLRNQEFPEAQERLITPDELLRFGFKF